MTLASARRLLGVSVLLLISVQAQAERAPWVGEDLSDAPCQGRGQAYGPYDYTNPAHVREKLPIVEREHFTPKVSSLQEGESSTLIGDIDYTLRAFPNHHPALYAVIRLYSESFRRSEVAGWPTPPECYLQRAIHFAPEDHRLYTLYGIYLHRLDRRASAEDMYQKALERNPDAAEAHYNYGLLLIDMGHHERARKHARRAYAQGYPSPGLRKRLAAAGFPLDSEN